MNAVPLNGFRKKDRVLSRRQMTSVMDEAMPAVIQHATLIEKIQQKIKEQDLRIDGLDAWHRATFLQRMKWLIRGNPS